MSRACRAERARLSAFIDERLDPAARAEVERHLAGCDRCRIELGRLRAVGPAVRAARPAARVPAGGAARAFERATREERPGPVFADTFVVAGRRAALVGAVAAALVWGGVVLGGGGATRSSHPGAVSAPVAGGPVDPAEAAAALWAADGTVYGE